MQKAREVNVMTGAEVLLLIAGGSESASHFSTARLSSLGDVVEKLADACLRRRPARRERLSGDEECDR